jgi:hypothetical protein
MVFGAVIVSSAAQKESPTDRTLATMKIRLYNMIEDLWPGNPELLNSDKSFAGEIQCEIKSR